MLQKPVLALRKNRKILAAENPVCGDPENWFTDTAFVERGIHAASFDFFVNWEKHAVCDEIWIKRIITSDAVFSKNRTELRDEIVKLDG